MEHKNIKLKTLKCIDHLVTGKLFSLLPDDKYQALRTSPVPNNIEPYYDHPDYISHQTKHKGLFHKTYSFVRHLNNRYKLKLIKSHAPEKGNLLDFGSGTGAFVDEAHKQGWTAKGYDPIVPSDKKSSSLYVNNWNQDKHYQCITAWHVLEHLPNPQSFFSQAHKSLSDKGTLAVALPNYMSFDADYYGEDWAAYDVPRHLWHFSPKGIVDLANDSGFECIKKHPLRIDAYYIALLSEKMRKSSFPWIRAIFLGLRSNCKANRTGMYSSIIYVFKKSK